MLVDVIGDGVVSLREFEGLDEQGEGGDVAVDPMASADVEGGEIEMSQCVAVEGGEAIPMGGLGQISRGANAMFIANAKMKFGIGFAIGGEFLKDGKGLGSCPGSADIAQEMIGEP